MNPLLDAQLIADRRKELARRADETHLRRLAKPRKRKRPRP
jgi:hypothetical protein